jgi:hypothetical protein
MHSAASQTKLLLQEVSASGRIASPRPNCGDECLTRRI